MRKFQVTVNGNTYEVEVEELLNGASAVPTTPVAPVVTPAPVATPTPVATPAPTATPASGSGTPVVAPMPGKLLSLHVKVGQQIKEGDLVGILEAMKMENELFSTATGTVTGINVQEGAMVDANDVIVTVQ